MDDVAAGLSAPASTRGDGSTPVGAAQWLTLTITLVATIVIVLDNTVLNVAIPTIMREFDTTLSSLQWVITGYALTFATFLIIGGRLGDVYGHRIVFIIGSALFGVGSFIASISWNVASLVVGEAIIEGLGASLMLPTALAIISTTFQGENARQGVRGVGSRDRLRRRPRTGPRRLVDDRLLVALVVPDQRRDRAGSRSSVRTSSSRTPTTPASASRSTFLAPRSWRSACSSWSSPSARAGRYGWIVPIRDVNILGVELWAADRSVSLIPIVFVVALGILFGFYRYERHRERTNRRPLFEFSLFRIRTFRYGLLASVFIAMAQLGTLLTMALFLQDAVRLDALQNGLWTLPLGLSILVGATVGGRLVRRLGVPGVVRTGLVIQIVGVSWIALHMHPAVTFLGLLPGLFGYGLGNGMATSQITNVVLSEVPVDKSGVASGTNSTIRQVGSALGIAIIGTLVTTFTVRHAVGSIAAKVGLSSAARHAATDQVRAAGTGYRPTGAGRVVAQLDHIASHSVASGTQAALWFAVGVLAVGAVLTIFIPSNIESPVPTDAELAEDLGSLGPIDVEPELVAPSAPVGRSVASSLEPSPETP